MDTLNLSLETNYNLRKKHFLEKKYLPVSDFPQLINFLECKGSLKVAISTAYHLYGYEIKGGGTISKSPRFRTQRRAEAEAVKLLIKMLDLNLVDLGKAVLRKAVR